MWTEGISEKSLKTQGSDINNHYQYTHGIRSPENHILYEPKNFKIKNLGINIHY